MQTSDFVAIAMLAVLPVAVLVAPGCLDASTCLRNSDCPADDICSVGACILAPTDTPPDGSIDGDAEAGTSDVSAPPADVTAPDGAARVDAGDAGDAGDAPTDHDAGDASSDADDAGDATPE